MPEVDADKMLQILEKVLGSRRPEMVAGSTSFLSPTQAASLMDRIERVRGWTPREKVSWFAAIDLCTDWTLGFPPGVRRIVRRTVAPSGKVLLQMVDLDVDHGKTFPTEPIDFRFSVEDLSLPSPPPWLLPLWILGMVLAGMVSLPWFVRPLPRFMDEAYSECLRRGFAMVIRILGGPLTLLRLFFKNFTFTPRHVRLPVLR